MTNVKVEKQLGLGTLAVMLALVLGNVYVIVSLNSANANQTIESERE